MNSETIETEPCHFWGETKKHLAVREAKSATDAMFQASLSDKEAFDRSNFAMTYLSKTADFREGPRAFMEKRPAKWTGKSGKKADDWLIEKLSEKQISKL